MKYDVTKCNNLNFKLASGLSGFMKVSPKGDCYFYQRDEIWDIGTMMLQPRFWRAVDFAEFNRFVEVNRIQIVPRNLRYDGRIQGGGIIMKHFDLQEYLKNPDRKLVTRDGRSARIICTDRLDSYPVVGLIRIGDCDEVCTYTKDGERYTQREDKYDLFFAPEKKEGWVNLFKINSTITTGEVYNTKEEAKSAVVGSLGYISTVKVEWEE